LKQFSPAVLVGTVPAEQLRMNAAEVVADRRMAALAIKAYVAAFQCNPATRINSAVRCTSFSPAASR